MPDIDPTLLSATEPQRQLPVAPTGSRKSSQAWIAIGLAAAAVSNLYLVYALVHAFPSLACSTHAPCGHAALTDVVRRTSPAPPERWVVNEASRAR